MENQQHQQSLNKVWVARLAMMYLVQAAVSPPLLAAVALQVEILCDKVNKPTLSNLRHFQSMYNDQLNPRLSYRLVM